MENIKENTKEDFSRQEGKKNKVLTFALIALVVSLLLFSAVQTFQIGSLEKSFFSGAAASQVSSGASPAALPGKSPSASAMVGGC